MNANNTTLFAFIADNKGSSFSSLFDTFSACCDAAQQACGNRYIVANLASDRADWFNDANGEASKVWWMFWKSSRFTVS